MNELLRRASDGHYPYTRAQLRADHPGRSLPKDIKPQHAAVLGLAVVTRVDPPEAEPGMTVVEVSPLLINGEWTQQWAQQPADPGPVPERVEAHKVLAEMEAMGILGPVTAIVNQGGFDLRIAFERAAFIDRDSDMVLAMADHPAVQMSAADLDGLFRRADARRT